jgi:hypothetical protein
LKDAHQVVCPDRDQFARLGALELQAAPGALIGEKPRK